VYAFSGVYWTPSLMYNPLVEGVEQKSRNEMTDGLAKPQLNK
jgi:hypothetical protein